MEKSVPLFHTNNSNNDEIETIVCKGGSHKASGSIYLKKYVPITLFYKNKIYDQKGMFNTCIDCRNYDAVGRKSRKKIIVEKNPQILTDKDTQILTEKDTQILTEKNPQILTEKNPQILTEKNPQILTEKNPQILTEKNPQIDQCNIQILTLENPQIDQCNIQTLTEENIEILDLQIFVICKSKVHGVSGSVHDKKCIPIHLFYKNGIDEIDGLVNNCLDCRVYINKSARKRNKKIRDACKELSQKLIDEGENFKVCENSAHGNLYISEFDRYKVPIYMFMKDTNDIRVGLFGNCSDCRKNNDNYQHAQKKKQLASELGIELCSLCTKELISTNICYNKDGKQSKRCVSCNYKGKLGIKTLRKHFNKLRMKYVIKHQTSCMLCNNIFIKNPGSNPPFDKLPIIIKDDIKYINYNNELISVESFLNIYHDLLELCIIEFDHLPENEFIKLYPNKKFIPKTRQVSDVRSEIKMELEAEKCQHLCLECHMKETIRRTEENRINILNSYKNKHKEEKIEFIRLHKQEQGCSLCGYNSLVRFLEFDHLEPALKIDGISKMVYGYDYSLEDVKKEMLKCRVLCKYCHVFHTKTQITDGIL